MNYIQQMLPHAALAWRAVTEFDLLRVVYHSRNSLTHQLFHSSSDNNKPLIPNTIYIEPTFACSRRCDGCYPEELGNPLKISEKLAHEAFKAAEQLGIYYVAWLGGEPLIPHVRELTLGVSKAHKKVATVICTNGDFLDEKVADAIAGITNIVPLVSIDGFKESNDRRRGQGSYDSASKAMGYLKERRAVFGYTTVLTADNYLEVSGEPFIDQMIERGNFVGSYLLFIAEKWHRLQPSAEQFAEATLRLNRIAPKKPLYVLSSEFGRLNGGHLLRGKRFLALAVDPFGNVRTERGGKPIDNLSEGRSLTDIILSEEVQSIFRKKLSGEEDAPDDGGRAAVRNKAYELLAAV